MSERLVSKCSRINPSCSDEQSVTLFATGLSAFEMPSGGKEDNDA